MLCCVLWAVTLSEMVVLSFLASPSEKKKIVFHLQVWESREWLKWWSGQEFNFTVKMIVEWKYWMQLSAPHSSPHSPLRSLAIANNKVNTSLDKVLLPTSMINCNSLSLLSLCLSLSFNSPSFFLPFSPFHPVTLNQSCAIRQLHKLFREVFAMCVCGVCVERSWIGLRMCTLVRVQSQVICSWKHIFPPDQNQQMILHVWNMYTHTHTHTHGLGLHKQAYTHSTGYHGFAF